MQPNDEQFNSAQLRGLLQEWPAPDLPASVEQRVLNSCTHRHRAWWRSLFTGYIRVPVYVVYVLAVLLSAAGWKYVARPTPGPCLSQSHVAAATPVSGTPHSHCDHSPSGFC